MLRIYNSLGKKIEEFKPLKDKEVGIYVCGPTVYGPDHLGHARTWVFFDWLRRFLLSENYKVNFVQNITDVGHLVGDEEEGEDKIEKEAKEKSKTPEEIAKEYEAEHFKDLESLNILKPDATPRATENIKEIIDFIKALIEKGNAYEADGNVYFDVQSFKEYGKLSGRMVEELLAGARVKIDPRKKHPADFALWLKADESHLQKWPSPWGEGYPGWHIECSVMGPKCLGQPFDIHGGGPDLKFPHHENEIAQSESYAGKPLANYWLHTGVLTINGQKMAKSAGNFITIKDILKKYDADMVKLAFMTTFWRSPFNWSDLVGEDARKVKEKLVRAKDAAKEGESGLREAIKAALEDDFNAPKALAVILGNISRLAKSDFLYIEEVFGLKLEAKKIELTGKQEKLLKERENARKTGDFKRSDEIREELLKEGIALEDTPEGQKFYRK